MSDEAKMLAEEYLKKWSAEQVPFVLREKLTYDFWEAIFLGITMGILPLLLAVWCWKNGPIKCIRKDDNHGYMFGFLLSSGIGTVCTIVSVMTIFKIVVAPRLYIIEWLRGMF